MGGVEPGDEEREPVCEIMREIGVEGKKKEKKKKISSSTLRMHASNRI